ncbi:hypothetical protein N7462_003524 [Penicillium macrosclerotiorum]|uniref:uncharacterized protein n=1 Tax=Penicillium macrosclerotiorum TaxID=303699 RepID=UPI00254814F8|nr:uncharacterized protein N7462_003524 [Penicillium macrosclerotiorum]KAJ5689132.1 hypothetical protein N7462_003524 [Penicillium macrosclerotiorum]
MTSTTLRAVTHRLTTTPVDQLPSIASFLATSLSDCAELLSAPLNQKPGKSDSDHAVQIHKLKTRLASLLQDRSVEGRWTAVILVKAAVEAGQWEILRGYEPIVRSLVGILAKPDPVSTKKMCLITLTRIFHLTYQYPTLVREITTPHLPGFITAALNLVSNLVKSPSGSTRTPRPNSPFMETVLHAMLELVPRHPTIFRPFGPQLRSLLAEVLGSSALVYFPEQVLDVSEQLFASLYKCAPKDKSGSGWTEDCKSAILAAHRAADHIFRSVVEQWESVDTTLVSTRQIYSKELADESSDPLGLPSWSGIHAGTDKLIKVLHILAGFVSMPSTATVAIPLGPILDLTSRLTSVVVPPNGEASQNGVQFNSQISRDERELLWAELPRIHTACMDLLAHVANVLGTSTIPIAQNIIDQVTWVFKNEKFSRDVRLATYDLLSSVVILNGPGMTKQSVASVANVLHACCHDLFPQTGDSTTPSKSQSDPKSKSKAGQGTANADSFLNPELQKSRQFKAQSKFPDLEQAASAFLQAFLVSAPAELLAASIRAEIDRTIILTSDKDAMLASVLNPVPAAKGRGAGSSIMPFLVRSYSDEMVVEALVRPRMPVLMTVPELDSYADMEEEEEDDEVEYETSNDVPNTAEFLKGPVMAPVAAPKSEVPAAQNKRTFFEETTAEVQASSPASVTQPVQVKKARFAEQTQPVVPPPATPSARVEASMVPQHVQGTSQTAKSSSAPSNSKEGPLPVDDSDDELPTLNMDPDTDDDDEENDDVTMED